MYIPTDLSGAVNILAIFVNMALEQANCDDIFSFLSQERKNTSSLLEELQQMDDSGPSF